MNGAIGQKWEHRLALKDLLSDDDSPESVAKIAVGMHERLEKFRLAHYPDDQELEDVSDEFHTIGFVDGPRGVADCEEFNFVLNALYDWADEGKRLWVD